MANDIKTASDGLALQVTKPARKAELVRENTDGDPTRLAEVYVYGVDDLLLVIDYGRVSASARAELVASAARDTKSLHQGGKASLSEAGNGYQVHLPGAHDAGFRLGDTAPVTATRGVLVIHDPSTKRLADDLIAQAESIVG